MNASVKNDDNEKDSEVKTWVESMRDFYHETGEVRTADMVRFLGDPGRAVYMQSSEEVLSGKHSLGE